MRRLLLLLSFPLVFFAGWLLFTSVPVRLKVLGAGPDCPWSSVLAVSPEMSRTHQIRADVAGQLRETAADGALDIVKFEGWQRAFWLPRAGVSLSGKQLLAYLIADHSVLSERYPDKMVRPGDVVIDCGAHVGVFTYFALGHGAARVISVEPDPVNRECLRRNLAPEIAAGRVTVVERGVWSSEKTLEFTKATDNSGHNSFVMQDDVSDKRVSIPVTTIDRLVKELGLTKASFIKMDIEGAEREALAGATETLRANKPRLMLDSYHLRDDLPVFRKVIRAAVPSYQYSCSACETFYPGLLAPHVTFWQAD